MTPFPRNTIRLPNTSPQNRRSFTHVRILTQVSADAWSAAGFEGALYQPGGRIAAEVLGLNPIALEYAGPQGTYKQRREREGLWILWRYDWEAHNWREIVRAVSRDWHWALVLREPAIRALRPLTVETPGVDAAARGREVADELLVRIDAALSPELPAVRRAVMCAVYDSMAGRLAAAA